MLTLLCEYILPHVANSTSQGSVLWQGTTLTATGLLHFDWIFVDSTNKCPTPLDKDARTTDRHLKRGKDRNSNWSTGSFCPAPNMRLILKGQANLHKILQDFLQDARMQEQWLKQREVTMIHPIHPEVCLETLELLKTHPFHSYSEKYVFSVICFLQFNIFKFKILNSAVYV